MVNLAAKHVVGAHYGLRDWLVQRVTAVVMLLWTLVVLGALMWSGGFDHASWKTLWAGEFFRLLSFLFVASVLWHAWVGVRNITMDYLKPVGLRVAVQSAVDLARRGGSMCLIGLAEGDAPISPGAWLVKEISVTSSLAYLHEEFEMSMGMIADGRVVVEPLHTATVGLDELEAALADLASGASQQIKVLVDPTGLK